MKKQQRKRQCLIWLSAIVFATSICSFGVNAANSNQIEYSGTLVALPCTVDPINENFSVDFGENIHAKNLVNGQRQYSREDLSFHLMDCDTSLGNTISVKLSGISTTSNGLLMVDANSEASGIVVGLETPSGVALPINDQAKPVVPITDKDMTIRLRAYVQGVENAAAESIIPGFFTATLTYTLIYQ